jgi:hypothetical protein
VSGELSVEAPQGRVAAPSARELGRAADGGEVGLRLDGLWPDGGLAACLACGHLELYTQRDFPRKLGLGVVVIAALLAPATSYVSLAVAAGLDWVLYRAAPAVVVCYVCGARHRGFAAAPAHPRFDREIDERLRYGERAVMGKPMRPGGTAGAPDPEH